MGDGGGGVFQVSIFEFEIPVVRGYARGLIQDVQTRRSIRGRGQILGNTTSIVS